MVVFDLGGVLVRICRSWEEACHRAGVPVRDGWDREDARAARKEASRAYHDGGLSTEAFCDRLVATAPGLYSPDEVRRVHDAWLIAEYEGVRELIDDLHARGVVTGVLSNTNAAHWARLHTPGEHAPFGVVCKVRHAYASHLMRLSKPDVACFRAFETSVGAAAQRGVVFFDDLEENIAGAEAAGWRGVLVDHTRETAAPMREALRRLGVV